jgi:prepilin-type N-terminal cleavage/methylation domain-containing protein
MFAPSPPRRVRVSAPRPCIPRSGGLQSAVPKRADWKPPLFEKKLRELRSNFPGEVYEGGFRLNKPRMTRITRMSVGMTNAECRMTKESVNRHSTIKNPTSDLRPLTSGERGHESSRGFTLIELLVVVGIIAILLVLMAPAFTYIKGGTDVTSAADMIKGVLDTARTYAKANNTYTWVGFWEEPVSQPSTNPATQGIGRIVMSIVASKDGTMLYTPPLTGVVTLPSASLIPVGKLTKIDNAHLKTFSDPSATPPPDTFRTRPTPGTPPNDLTARIGNDATDPATAVAPANPSLKFNYPLGGSQYPFVKIIQFSPRGEGVIDNSNYNFAPICEIGVEPTHGAAVPVPTPANVFVVQFNGFAGDVKIYRK